jgi:hypothetical protein
VAVTDRASRGVTITPRQLEHNGSSRQYLDVACELVALHDLFAVLCDEMLQQLGADPDRPGQACQRVLDRWRVLLSPAESNLLGAEALTGLLAELRFMERLAIHDPSVALALWAGPSGGRFDFTASHAAVEVKATTARERLAVEIHGIQQLDSDPAGELYLHVEQFEVVPAGGDCVPDAVDRLLQLGVQASRLLENMAQIGYRFSDSEAYRKIRRVPRLHRTFRATAPGFPRLVPTSLADPTVLDRISRIRYTIDLTDASHIPGALHDVEAAVIHLLGGATA